MAKWTSSGDITKDLDCLSEMTCGRRVTTTSPIFKPPVARGKHAAHMQPVILDPFEDHRIGFEHSTYNAETIKGFGRGEVIDKMWKTLHNKNDNDLQWQLRAACGAGYSNDLIENAFRQESSSDQDSDQFEDATTEMETGGTTRSSSKSDFSTTDDPGSSEKSIPAATDPLAAADAPVSAENSNSAALEKSPSRELVKRKPRKYTNVLMDNLIRMKGASEESILSTTNLNPDAEPFECHVSVNTSSVQTENLNPDAQPFECHISVDSVSSNETNDRLSHIHQASNSTPPRKHKYNYPVRPTSHNYGYTNLVSYDNRPVHHANDFFCIEYDPVPVQEFQFRSEEFPPLS